MAALPWFWTKTSALIALRTAVYLGEFLAIMWPRSPAAGFTRFIASFTLTLGLCIVVNVNVFGARTGDYFVPVYGLHVAEVVIVEEANTALKYFCNKSMYVLK